ncbi:MAG: DoxX family membrane protein [Bacteroidetes bacterium]|nr:DoxX family membrane protein [Bacteroidota bacterium]
MNKRIPSSSSTDFFLLFLRLFASAGMLLNHGIPKLERLFSGEEIKFYSFLGMGPVVSLVLAVFAEAICSALVAVGLWSRYAAIPVMFTMLVAAFGAGWDRGFKGMEMALLYFFLFTVVFVFGPGKYSLDKNIHPRK